MRVLILCKDRSVELNWYKKISISWQDISEEIIINVRSESEQVVV